MTNIVGSIPEFLTMWIFLLLYQSKHLRRVRKTEYMKKREVFYSLFSKVITHPFCHEYQEVGIVEGHLGSSSSLGDSKNGNTMGHNRTVRWRSQGPR